MKVGYYKSDATEVMLSTQCSFYLDPPIIEGNMEAAKAVDLIPWMEYEFRVVATNTLGIGEPSIPSNKIKTDGAGT